VNIVVIYSSLCTLAIGYIGSDNKLISCDN